MAKKVENYWNVKVTTTGRKRIFDKPEVLWAKACEYFDWCVENPLVSVDYKGKDAIPVKIYNVRAFTIEGLCLHLGVGRNYLEDCEKKAIAGKTDEISLEFSGIIKRIREIIRSQKFENAAAGLLNPMIIARDLGLTERKEIMTQINMSQVELQEKFKGLPEDQQNALLSLAETLGFDEAEFEEID